MSFILFCFSKKDKRKKILSLTKCNLVSYELAFEKDQSDLLNYRINAWLHESTNSSEVPLRAGCICFQPTVVSDSKFRKKDLQSDFHEVTANVITINPAASLESFIIINDSQLPRSTLCQKPVPVTSPGSKGSATETNDPISPFISQSSSSRQYLPYVNKD
jgi:hypothetical protein